MIFKLYTRNHCFRQFHSIFSKLTKSKAMTKEKCYFKYMKQEERVDISFILNIKGSLRQFNFSRNHCENLQTLFNRIETNISKVVNKSSKKKLNFVKEEISVNFIDNDHIPETYTCKELFDLEGPIKLKIHDTIFEAVFNSPWVLKIDLPKSILVGFPVYPEHLEIQYGDKDNCTFNWYTGICFDDKGKPINEATINWKWLASGIKYTPTIEDIGNSLKLECIPGNGTLVGPAVETISKNVIEAGPGKCPFETRQMFTTSKLKDRSFRCVSYNILADLYCDSEHTRTVLHPYCPPYALHIDYRKQLIIKELVGYNADVLCLQEVDKKIFIHCLSPLLQMEGLNGSFYKKGKEVAEGLACFYRKDRFEFIGEDHIVLAKAIKTESYLKPIWDAIQDNVPLVDRLLDRSTIASATFLKSIDNKNEILLVGNTHLYFHPNADHIRLLQGGIVVYWLSNIRNTLLSKFPDKRVTVVLCGDFNSVPSCGIYQLYTTGLAPQTLPDWKSYPIEAVNNLSLQQELTLQSACGTPQYTNFTDGFADCLDYIYYDKSNLTVEQVVPFPSEEELKSHTALPSIVFPSDHIALISDLMFK